MAIANTGEVNLEIVVSVLDMASPRLKALEEQFQRLNSSPPGSGSGAPDQQGGIDNENLAASALGGLSAVIATILTGNPIAGFYAGTTVGLATREHFAYEDALKAVAEIGIQDPEEFFEQRPFVGNARTELYRLAEYAVDHRLAGNEEQLGALLDATRWQAIQRGRDPYEFSKGVMDLLWQRNLNVLHEQEPEYIVPAEADRLSLTELAAELSKQFLSDFSRVGNPFSRAQSDWLSGKEIGYYNSTEIEGRANAPLGPENADLENWLHYKTLTEEAGDSTATISPSDADLENWLRYKTLTEEASTSTQTLTTFTHGLSSAEETLYDYLDDNREALGLQSNEVGHLRAVWGETTDLLGKGSSVLDNLTQSSHDLDRKAANARDTLGSLQSLDFSSFAEGSSEAFGAAENQIARVGKAALGLADKFAILGEGKATGAATEAIDNFHRGSAPQLGDLARKAASLQGSLRGIPRRVRSNVRVDIRVSGDVQQARALGIPLGQYRAISKELATGGPLGDVSLVGEEGPEFIIDGVVVPTRETRKLMSLGLLPRRRYAVGGPLGGAGPVRTSPEPEDFDPLNLEQRALLRSGGAGPSDPGRPSHRRARAKSSGGGRSARSRSQENAELSTSIREIVEASLAEVVPQTAIVAAQAAGAVAPASITAANAQMSRELARNLEVSNDRLAGLMEQLILETRRMKTYFRDAVRLITD
jgi:hypothetical protein